MLLPYDYWQFWRNTEDSDVGRFLRLFTDIPMEEIARLEILEGSEINEAKKILADATTALCHSKVAASSARQTAEITFEQGGLSDKLPTFKIEKFRLEQGVPAFQLFHEVQLANSGGEARRLIKGGGAKLNDIALPSEIHIVTTSDLNSDGVIKLSAGKKRHVLVHLI
jgi:tyrosyl-tRNA synthetase